VTVYVSLPLTGPRGADGRDAADGARLALEQADGRAGELEVGAEFLDDANGEPWDPVAVGANARTAAADSTTAAYIGELDSQPTRASLPITNDAGIVQVSPGAGAVDLTRPAEGYEDSPDRYRPSGNATFARVVPADDAEAQGMADLAAELDARTLSAVSDRTPYGELMVAGFTQAAEEAGLQVPEEAAAVDLSFSAKEDEGLRLSGPDASYASASVLDPSNLPEPGFATDFESRFERAPGPYAAYGYEAMSLVLAAITDAEGSDRDFRSAVADAVLSAERPDSVLGSYSITDNGDSTLCAIQPYRVGGLERTPEKPICPSG
jgi:branched-chain amino acid transport system substrate-binding protein